MYDADFYGFPASQNSSSSRNSLFSILSSSSQATSRSNQSQSRRTFAERLQLGIGQQPQDWPLHEVIELANQGSPIPIPKNDPPVHICVACNIPFTKQSSLIRHQREHCERKVEWICWLCVPTKNFYRKEKLSQHHIENHGEACVPGCKQRGGLCEPHLKHSVFELPSKKAWGCPCCLRCFDTVDDWTRHGRNHPVQNDKIVGWSLSIMVKSLLFQPYLTDAVAHLPWDACDPAKVKAEVCQDLREALERHTLPDAVQGHYDYRHLRLPEALAQYAFRLIAYGGPYLDEVATVATNTNAVEAATKQLRKEFQSPLTVPTILKPSDPPASGYWNPNDPFTYPQRAHLPTDSVSVRDYLDIHLLHDAFNVAVDMHPASTIAQSPRGGRSVQSHDQTMYASSAALSSEQAPSSQLLGSAGGMPFQWDARLQLPSEEHHGH